jgi:hypothetical protein
MSFFISVLWALLIGGPGFGFGPHPALSVHTVHSAGGGIHVMDTNTGGPT